MPRDCIITCFQSYEIFKGTDPEVSPKNRATQFKFFYSPICRTIINAYPSKLILNHRKCFQLLLNDTEVSSEVDRCIKVCISNITVSTEAVTIPTSTEIPYIEGATARQLSYKFFCRYHLGHCDRQKKYTAFFQTVT